MLADPSSYDALTDLSLPAYLAAWPDLRARLGGAPEQWRVREVGDGNLNLVFLVHGPAGKLCVKQSLPYVRVAPDWPMPLDRAVFEHAYYRRVGPHVQGLAPEILHHDPALFCTAMELLEPHVILRRGLVAGHIYPTAARDVGRYIARAGFFTSDFARPFEAKYDDMALFGRNQSIQRITVDLVFADPYRRAPRNRWTSPQLDDIAAAVRADPALRRAAARFGHRYLTCPQALLHGDLHTGSVMVTPDDTRVIDPEFCTFGPIGFDTGAFVANLLMAYFAQPGHAAAPGERDAARAWLLDSIGAFWAAFAAGFLDLWREHAAGDGYPPVLFDDAAGQAALEAERAGFLHAVFADTVGYAGTEIIRRILGFAHNLDFEAIADPARRAACERPALELARAMLVDPAAFAAPADLVAAAQGLGDGVGR